MNLDIFGVFFCCDMRYLSGPRLMVLFHHPGSHEIRELVNFDSAPLES